MKIDLKDWTSYYALEPHHYRNTAENIWVLLEAVRPESSQLFAEEEFNHRNIHVRRNLTNAATMIGNFLDYE